MAKEFFHLSVEGLDGMTRDFERLSTPEPFQHGAERLKAALDLGFEGTQQAVPVDEGDHRRPAGALRDSGRATSSMQGEIWRGEIAYGTEDDVLPYAAWVRYRNLRKTGEDFLGDPMDAVTPVFDDAVNAPFDDVFHG